MYIGGAIIGIFLWVPCVLGYGCDMAHHMRQIISYMMLLLQCYLHDSTFIV